MARFLITEGQLDEAEQLLDEANALVTEESPTKDKARLVSTRARIWIRQGRVVEATRLARKGLGLTVERDFFVTEKSLLHQLISECFLLLSYHEHAMHHCRVSLLHDYP